MKFNFCFSYLAEMVEAVLNNMYNNNKLNGKSMNVDYLRNMHKTLAKLHIQSRETTLIINYYYKQIKHFVRNF